MNQKPPRASFSFMSKQRQIRTASEEYDIERTSTVRAEVGPNLLIFDILRQNGELLLHDSVLSLVAECSLALSSELVFKTVPNIIVARL